MSDWTDAIVGDRMAVDREFDDRIAGSEFSNQEWGLIMTATEFDIEHADDPERARIVADTSNLPQIMPELEKLQTQMAAVGGGAASDDSSRSVLDKVLSALGISELGPGGGSDSVDEDRLEAAEALVQEYAQELQTHLEANGKFEQVRVAYQE